MSSSAKGWTFIFSTVQKVCFFLASPDAPEVMLVTESHSVSTDLTDVTLVSDYMYLTVLKKMKKMKKKDI